MLFRSRLHNVKQSKRARGQGARAFRFETYESVVVLRCRAAGGADRDRTDDLKLAKLALSQLSYGPWVRLIDVSNGGPGTS